MKRLKNIALLGMMLGLLWSCGGTKSAESIALKNRQFEELKTLVATKSFIFNAETAYPMQTYAVMQVNNALLRNTGNSAGRISLTGNGDFIKVNGDTVKATLAYFGEVRIVTSLDPRDAGINFDGEPYSYEVTANEKKQTVKVAFEVKESTEQFSVIMQLYPNKRVTVFITTVNRASIRYDGQLKELDETETALR